MRHLSACQGCCHQLTLLPPWWRCSLQHRRWQILTAKCPAVASFNAVQFGAADNHHIMTKRERDDRFNTTCFLWQSNKYIHGSPIFNSKPWLDFNIVSMLSFSPLAPLSVTNTNLNENMFCIISSKGCGLISICQLIWLWRVIIQCKLSYARNAEKLMLKT